MADYISSWFLITNCITPYLDRPSVGVNDVSWPRHSLASSSASVTPQLARLARSGLVLDSVYTLPICSPSRAAILTGVYPFRMGLQVCRIS